jgi:hypothetical protein
MFKPTPKIEDATGSGEFVPAADTAYPWEAAVDALAARLKGVEESVRSPASQVGVATLVVELEKRLALLERQVDAIIATIAKAIGVEVPKV